MSSAASNCSAADGEAGELTEVVVVRHGETSWNASRIIQSRHSCGRCMGGYVPTVGVLPLIRLLHGDQLLTVGHLDAELNGIGRQQAVAVAHRLSKEVKPVAIYSSDLKRAAETAETIATFCNLPNEVVLDPALRERHIGDLQGLNLQDAAKTKPEAYKAFMSHKRHKEIPGGGESLDQLSERCVPCLYKIAEKHKGERVIVVSHGGTIRELYRHASPLRPLHSKIHNTAVSIFLISGVTGRWIIKMWGDISHLRETGVLDNGFGGDKASG